MTSDTDRLRARFEELATERNLIISRYHAAWGWFKRGAEFARSEREAGRQEAFARAIKAVCFGCATDNPLESNAWHRDLPHICKAVAIRALAAEGGKQP